MVPNGGASLDIGPEFRRYGGRFPKLGGWLLAINQPADLLLASDQPAGWLLACKQPADQLLASNQPAGWLLAQPPDWLLASNHLAG